MNKKDIDKKKAENENHKSEKVAEVNSTEIDVESEIRSAEEDAKKHYDKLLRVMAEFENFKKRMGKEKEDLIRYGNEKLLGDLIPALDDLDRVLDHIAPDAPEDVKKIADGVELVRKSLTAILEKNNMKEVPALGVAFDPNIHEAIAMVESEQAPGTVISVHRKGYILFDRLIRPAMVTVAKAP